MFFQFLIALAILSLVASLVMAYQALTRAGRLELELRGLKQRLDGLPESRESERTDAPAPEPAPRETGPAETTNAPDDADESPWNVPVQTGTPQTANPRRGWRAFLIEDDPDRPAGADQDTGPAPRRQSIEEKIASRWLVWLGSLTIGLGGIFLVKYGIDNDLLSPAVRVGLGALLGIALTFGGEWLRRNPVQQAIAQVREDYVPPALTAAGIAIAYGSIYAGYALYGLFAPLVAFAGLAGVAMLALALSLLQGPFVAAIGILGAFGAPLLIHTAEPSAWALFPYLLVVAGGALAIVRYRDWLWLAWSTLLLSAFWNLAWMAGTWHAGDTLALGLHVILLLVMFIAVRIEAILQPPEAAPQPGDTLFPQSWPQVLALSASTVFAVLLFCLVRMDLYGAVSLSIAGVVIAIFLGCAFRLRLELLLPLAAVTAVALLSAWHLPVLLGYRPAPNGLEMQIRLATAPIFPPDLTTFALFCLLTAVLFAVVGFVGLWRSRNPGLWSAVSAIVPLAVLAIAYWRMRDAEVYLSWAGIGLALSATACLAAGYANRFRDRHGFDPVIGSYALATTGAISVTAAILLEESWLTIGLALQLPALAWIDAKLKIPALRAAAFVLAGIVGVRMLFLHFLPGIPLLIRLDPWWLLYSYGIPALSFAFSAYWFRRTADGRLVELLRALAVATAVALCNMEIRCLIGDGTLGHGHYSLLEQSLHSITWLVSGYGLYRRNRTAPGLTTEWGSKILIGLATAQIVLLQVTLSNPVVAHEDVGRLPVFGVISLAYGIPAIFAWLIHNEARRQNHARVTTVAAVLGTVLALLDVSLEVRHVFHGRFLDSGVIGDAEGYAYSATWLVCAGMLLALGIWRQSTALRHASLGMVLLVVAKVFLWDMAWLTGLYRVASFLGLGLSLVAVGYLYQRLVFSPAGQDEPDQAASP